MAELETGDQPHAGGRPLLFETVAELDRAINAYFKSKAPRWTYKTEWVLKRNRNGKLVKDIHGQDQWVKHKMRRQVMQQPITMSGLAAALHTSRQTLINYRERPEFFDSIANAKTRCEEYAESQLFDGNSNGAKFNLTNNHDWEDRHAVTGKDGAPLMPVGLDPTIIARLNARANENASQSPTEDS